MAEYQLRVRGRKEAKEVEIDNILRPALFAGVPPPFPLPLPPVFFAVSGPTDVSSPDSRSESTLISAR